MLKFMQMLTSIQLSMQLLNNCPETFDDECDECDKKGGEKGDYCSLCAIHRNIICKECCADLPKDQQIKRLEGSCPNCKGHFDIYLSEPHVINDWCSHCNPSFGDDDDSLHFLIECYKKLESYKKRHPNVDILEHLIQEKEKDEARKEKEKDEVRKKLN